MHVSRSRGAVSGFLLVLLGAVAALLPFVGPYFNFAYTPDDAWHYTQGRLIFEILPGAAALVGGLLVLASAHRAMAMLGGWLAALGGAWLIVGLPLSPLWDSPAMGDPTGGTNRQALESVAFFGGIGAVIVFLAAFALGRFAVVSVRDVERAERLRTPGEAAEPTPDESPDVDETTTTHRLLR